MELVTRPVIAASVALLGAGMIAATPTTPTTLPAIQTPSIQFTSGFDPITPWVETLNQAFTNVTALGSDLVTPPVPVLQQVIVNQVGFLQDFLQNPGDIGNILREMWGNLVAGVSVPFEPDSAALDGSHQLAFGILSSLVPVLFPDDQELVDAILNFSTTPISGLLWGSVGTFVSPLLELSNSIGSIIEAIQDNDWVGVLNDIVNIPAQVTDGFLNGYGTIDLTSLVEGVTLPIGTIRSLSIELGGLLSPGGSPLFDALGADICTTLPIVGCRSIPPFPISGNELGPLGSLIETSHNIAQEIGWDGTGNPISALLTDMASDLGTFVSGPVAGDVSADAAAGAPTDIFAELLAAVGI
jgi:hypothetical protein